MNKNILTEVSRIKEMMGLVSEQSINTPPFIIENGQIMMRMSNGNLTKANGLELYRKLKSANLLGKYIDGTYDFRTESGSVSKLRNQILNDIKEAVKNNDIELLQKSILPWEGERAVEVIQNFEPMDYKPDGQGKTGFFDYHNGKVLESPGVINKTYSPEDEETV